MHQKLLSEMKRRRLFYLRKTPQDLIIEELMLEHRCTQEKAEQIYLQRLADNKLLREESNSPARSNYKTNNEGKVANTEDGGQFLAIKSIYDNIIHATSPNRSRAASRAASRQSPAGELRVEHSQRAMRRPVSPYNQQVAEVDHEEAEKSFGSPGRSNRAPYIIVKSPEEHSKKKQKQSATNSTMNFQNATNTLSVGANISRQRQGQV